MKGEDDFENLAAASALLRSAMAFQQGEGQDWLMTYEQRHSLGQWTILHVYAEGLGIHLIVWSVRDEMELEVEQNHYVLDAAQQTLIKTQLIRLQNAFPFEVGSEAYARDGVKHRLEIAGLATFEWEYPTTNFQLLQPLLDLIKSIPEN